MSTDILTVTTQFADIVSLAQGYINRADGERLLLPLPSAARAGDGLRFVVILADGTPAFAGAGLCSQVSDQGSGVPAEQRYETLLDSLQFDERSRPVYDYIVAVRNAAYAQAAPSESAGDDAELTPLDEGETAVEIEGDAASSTAHDPHREQVIWSASHQDGAEGEAPSSWAPSRPPSGAPVPIYEPVQAALNPSFVPPPIPTGILTRPARAAHWQPLPPRRPTPRPSSGMFRYPLGPLPVPARPPHPDIDPSQRVAPAPRPQ